MLIPAMSAVKDTIRLGFSRDTINEVVRVTMLIKGTPNARMRSGTAAEAKVAP